MLSRDFCEKSVRENFYNFHTVSHAQCGNYANSLSRIFGENFVKITVLLNKLLNSWFDEIFLWWERISRFSTVNCLLLRTLQSKKYFVKSTLVIYLVKPLFSRNFWQNWVKVNFRIFHTVLNTSTLQRDYYYFHEKRNFSRKSLIWIHGN